ncbi:MAG: hypothetical protein AAF723_08575, partial [Pseudomonadota bacterium]
SRLRPDMSPLTPPLSTLPREQLDEMHQAAHMVSETMRVLQKSGTNLVAEILSTEDEFVEWAHIPNEDVFDPETHSQYYYHAHPKSEEGTGAHDDEHGHFHCFLRGPALVDRASPSPRPQEVPKKTEDIVTHVIGIGMNSHGVPMRLFTVNRWVTGETWYEGEDLIPLLGQFEVDLSTPSWPLNLWISHMIPLFRPQIETLIRERDRCIAAWQEQHPDRDVFEDRALEVTSSLDIDLAQHVGALVEYLENSQRSA